MNSVKMKRSRFISVQALGLSAIASDLNESLFSGSRLSQVTFRNSDLRGVRFGPLERDLYPKEPCEMREVDMSDALLTGAKFIRCTLQEVKMKGATLDGADLSTSWLADVDFSDASLKDTKFARSQLENSRLTEQQLREIVAVDDPDYTAATSDSGRIITIGAIRGPFSV